MSTAPRLTIDLTALAANWQHLAKVAAEAETAAVIKADAYGIGIGPAVSALSAAGCQTFFVAMAEEGARARAAAPNATIFILNGIFSDTIEAVLEHRLTPVLGNRRQVDLWASRGAGMGCALHVDTGMNRLGMDADDLALLASETDLVEKLHPQLLMSHLACADEPGHPLNDRQHGTFLDCASRFNGLRLSFSNSAATLTRSDFHHDLVRPGVALYGGEAVNEIANPMKPVVTAEARILQIRNAKAGEVVGYGAEAVLERDTRIATISTGYADGFHRSGSGAGVPLRSDGSSGGTAWLEGTLVPVLGRVSMDLVTLDVTDVPQSVLEKAEWVELFGNNIAIDDAARACGTIGYELLTSLGSRYLREYKS